jgi:nucleoside-diphosphate-sugar epimerase
VSKVLVTGSAGFIGGALVRRLRLEGHEVAEFDLAQGDITCEGVLDTYTGITHCFHLAGKTFVPESWKHPQGFYQVNLMGTVNVLEFCRKNSIPLTYVASYLYGEPEYLPVDEIHPLKSYNPYSHSKVMADNTCQFYARQFGLPVTIFRPFNAYGPTQSPLFIIPEIITKFIDPSIPVVEVMDLRPKRDYIYIDDIIEAFMRSMDRPGGIYNLGSGYSKSVEEIVTLVKKYTGIDKPVRAKGNDRPNEIFDLYADISKAKRELGWEPVVSFEEGVMRCVEVMMYGRTGGQEKR